MDASYDDTPWVALASKRPDTKHGDRNGCVLVFDEKEDCILYMQVSALQLARRPGVAWMPSHIPDARHE